MKQEKKCLVNDNGRNTDGHTRSLVLTMSGLA